jgi:hypothetical protein
MSLAVSIFDAFRLQNLQAFGVASGFNAAASTESWTVRGARGAANQSNLAAIFTPKISRNFRKHNRPPESNLLILFISLVGRSLRRVPVGHTITSITAAAAAVSSSSIS